MDKDITEFIDKYVQQLKTEGLIHSEAVERAFRKVRRDLLLESCFKFDKDAVVCLPVKSDLNDPAVLELIYSDEALITRIGPDGKPTSSTSQPALMANMLELLDLKPGMRVLEIGAGTGYNAALMAEIIGDPSLVTTIDIQPDVIEQTSRLLAKAGYGGIRVLLRDGFLGCPERAPFDRIVGTVCCTDLSPHWANQLAPDGNMLIPLQHGGPNTTPLMKVSKENGNLVGCIAGWSGFMNIQGEMSIQHPWARAPWDSSLDDSSIRRLPPLPEMPDCGWEWEKLTLLDFHYFLALEDRRTCNLQRGFGLWDENKGFVLSPFSKEQEPVTRLYGDESLYREYLEIYERWHALGRPRARDFASEFQILGSVNTQPSLYKQGDSWVIERKFFRQIVRLES